MSISRSKLTIDSQIPDGDVFSSFSRGFQSFFQIQRTIQSSEFRNSRNCPRATQISHTLNQNKCKLYTLRREIQKKRDQSYEKYIENTIRHRKLMQLNTLKKRLVNSLNKNIGQIKVKSLEELSGVQLIYEYHAQYLHIKGCKPQPRTGQTCISFRGNIYAMGGHNSTPLKSIWMLGLKEMAWKKLEPSQLMRSGHSILVYKNTYAVVFGGTSFYNTFTHERQCENNVSYFFDIALGVPKHIKAQQVELIQPRKNHAAIILGHRMLVFGGLSSKQKYLKDLVYLDFKTVKWSAIEYQFASDSAENFIQSGIAHAVFGLYFKNKNSTKLASISYTQQQGLYLFGGSNGHGQSNKLLQIRLNKRVPVIHRIYPQGVGPSHISPSVLPFGQDSFLILSGERNYRCLYMYKVLQNKYIKVECGEQNIRLGGIGSSLTQIDGKYYVLFGIGDKGFNSEVITFELRLKKNTGRSRKLKANSLQRLASCGFSVISDKASDN